MWSCCVMSSSKTTHLNGMGGPIPTQNCGLTTSFCSVVDNHTILALHDHNFCSRNALRVNWKLSQSTPAPNVEIHLTSSYHIWCGILALRSSSARYISVVRRSDTHTFPITNTISAAQTAQHGLCLFLSHNICKPQSPILQWFNHWSSLLVFYPKDRLVHLWPQVVHNACHEQGTSLIEGKENWAHVLGLQKFWFLDHSLLIIMCGAILVQGARTDELQSIDKQQMRGSVSTQ